MWCYESLHYRSDSMNSVSLSNHITHRTSPKYSNSKQPSSLLQPTTHRTKVDSKHDKQLVNIYIQCTLICPMWSEGRGSGKPEIRLFMFRFLAYSLAYTFEGMKPNNRSNTMFSHKIYIYIVRFWYRTRKSAVKHMLRPEYESGASDTWRRQVGVA